MQRNGDYTDGAVAIVNFKYLRGIDLKADLTTVATALVHHQLVHLMICSFPSAAVSVEQRRTSCLWKGLKEQNFVEGRMAELV